MTGGKSSIPTRGKSSIPTGGKSSVPDPGSVRVLVIDDDELAREFMCEVLRQAGFEVASTESAIGATNRIVRERIRVVVIDVMMPTIRGDKLANLLRKNGQLGQLGVVLVSACPREELVQTVADLDADAVVNKADARTLLAPAVMRAAQTAGTSHRPRN